MGSAESWETSSKSGGSLRSQKDDFGVESIPELANQGAKEAKRLVKGKGREESNPFRDPSSDATQRQSLRPTPRTPIVTPGRAPTIRHRAIEQARRTGESGRMPSIVATDADEEVEAVRHLQDLVIDPFQSASEMDEQRRYAMARDSAKRTILDGDEGAPIMAPPPPPPLRKSFSDSKFNEIGLDDENGSNDSEEGGNTTPKPLDARSEEPQQAARRNTWWTEWLCGCGNVEGDGEQSGRTCPEW